MHTHADRRTVAGAHALPHVMWGDVTGPGSSEMAQVFSHQLDSIPAASRRTPGAQTPIVDHPGDAET